MRLRGSQAISPTAHYTGCVWARNGLSHRELLTCEGRGLFEALRPLDTFSGLMGGPTLEDYLLARHLAIDAMLERAIERGEVSHVVELACGLSPRGWRFAKRYGAGLTYMEADLPAMAQRKRLALARIGSLSAHHRVEAIDALREQGAGSLAALMATLEPDAGVAIVTEGLLGYLEYEAMEGMWRGFARQLSRFRAGLYLSDIHLGSEAGLTVRAFRLGLAAFVRGPVHLHFTDADDASLALRRAGFSKATMRRAVDLSPAHAERRPGGRLAHVLQASCGATARSSTSRRTSNWES